MSNSYMDERILRAIEKYGDTVYRLALHYVKSAADAEDVVQEVLFSYIRHTPNEEREKAETTKQKLFRRVQSEWDYSREYRLKFERMRTANILLAVFITVLCVTNVAMATVKKEEEPIVRSNGGTEYRLKMGETFSCYDCAQKEIGYSTSLDGAIYNGSFCFDSLTVAKTIQKDGKIYESDKDYFLIVKNTLDLDEFSVHNGYIDYLQFDSIFCPTLHTFLERQKGTCVDSHSNIDCLNLQVTKELNRDIAVYEPPREARGALYLCMDIDQDFYAFLRFQYIYETQGLDGIWWEGVPALLREEGFETREEIQDWGKKVEEFFREEEERLKENEKKGYVYGNPPLDLRDAFTYCPSMLYNHIRHKDSDGIYREDHITYYGCYSDINFLNTLNL